MSRVATPRTGARSRPPDGCHLAFLTPYSLVLVRGRIDSYKDLYSLPVSRPARPARSHALATSIRSSPARQRLARSLCRPHRSRGCARWYIDCRDCIARSIAGHSPCERPRRREYPHLLFTRRVPGNLVRQECARITADLAAWGSQIHRLTTPPASRTMQRRSAAAPPVSPPNSAGPSSHGMVRKRTLQDLQPPSSPNMQSFPHPGSSSSPSIQHSFQFDSSPRNAQLSSPASIYSSPGMARSASAQATFSPFRQTITTSPLGRMCEQDEEVPGGRRPGMKRRRTIAGDSPTSPVKQDNSVSQQLSYTPRCAGKDGEDVWPPDVEEAFHTGPYSNLAFPLRWLTLYLLQHSLCFLVSGARSSSSTASPADEMSLLATTSSGRQARLARASRSQVTFRS